MVKKGVQILFLLLFAPVLILAGLKLFTDLRVRATEKKYPPCGKFVTVRGIRLHYISKGLGRPLVLIHGSYGSLHDFAMSFFELTAEKYQTFAFDRPGHGYSERPRGRVMTPLDHARYIHGALEALDARNPILVGHSYGAAVALAYAVEYPDQAAALILLAGYVTYFEGPAELIYRLPAWPVIGKIFLYAILQPLGLLRGPRALVKSAFSPNKPHAAYSEVLTSLALRPRQFAATAEDIRNFSPAMKKLSADFDKIKIPVTIITGDKDSVASPKGHAYPLSKQIPHSRLIILPETGHQPGFIKPDAIMQAIGSIDI